MIGSLTRGVGDPLTIKKMNKKTWWIIGGIILAVLGILWVFTSPTGWDDNFGWEKIEETS